MRYPSGYGIVFKAVVCDPSIDIGPKALYALLAAYTGADEVCWPSVTTMAKCLGVTGRAVQLWMRVLESKGWVQMEPVNGSSNKYHLTTPEPGFTGGVNEGSPGGCTGVHPTINNETKNKDKKESAAPMPSVGVTVPTKPVTDLFASLYSENCGGARFSFKQYFIFPTQALIRNHGLDSVLSVVRGYFATEWWFTKDKSNGGKRTWSYSGFLNHYDEVQSGLRQRPVRTEIQRKNAEAAARLVRRTG